jgi:hypothetical protein
MENIKLSKIISFSKYTVLFITLLLIFVFSAILSLGIDLLPYNFQPPLFGTEKIYRQTDFMQSFTAKEDSLSAIGLSIKNWNMQTKEGLVLRVFKDSNKIREVVVGGEKIKDGDIHIFAFEPIPDSRGQTYIFSLEAPDVSQERAFEVFYTNQIPSWANELLVNGKTSDKVLSFVTYYRPQSRLALIIQLYSEWLAKFISDRFFAVFYISTLLVLSALTLIVRRKAT